MSDTSMKTKAEAPQEIKRPHQDMVSGRDGLKILYYFTANDMPGEEAAQKAERGWDQLIEIAEKTDTETGWGPPSPADYECDLLELESRKQGDSRLTNVEENGVWKPAVQMLDKEGKLLMACSFVDGKFSRKFSLEEISAQKKNEKGQAIILEAVENDSAVKPVKGVVQSADTKKSGVWTKVAYSGLGVALLAAYLSVPRCDGNNGKIGLGLDSSGPQEETLRPKLPVKEEPKKIPPVSLIEERVTGDVVAKPVPAKRIEENRSAPVKLLPKAADAGKKEEKKEEKKIIKPIGTKGTDFAAVTSDVAALPFAKSELGSRNPVFQTKLEGERSAPDQMADLTPGKEADAGINDAFEMASLQSPAFKKTISRYTKTFEPVSDGGAKGSMSGAKAGHDVVPQSRNEAFKRELANERAALYPAIGQVDAKKHQSTSPVSLECERQFNGATQTNGKYTEVCFYGDDNRLVFMATYHDKDFKKLDVERWYDKGGQVDAERYYNNGVVTKETRKGRVVNIEDNAKLDYADLAVNQQPH